MSRIIDLTGQKFHEWTVLERDKNAKPGTAKWICQCSCGNIKSVAGSTLRNGTSKSCGCKKIEKSRENNGTFINEIGNRYGKLVVIAKDEELSIQKHRAQWICKCDCGNYKTVSSKCLRDGKTKSCGCLVSEGEEIITKILTKLQASFKAQYGVNIDNKWYRFDFALLDNNAQPLCFIEFNGIQHYDTKNLHWGQSAKNTQKRDAIKIQWAKDNDIPLHIIPYIQIKNIEKILIDIVKEPTIIFDIEKF